MNIVLQNKRVARLECEPMKGCSLRERPRPTTGDLAGRRSSGASPGVSRLHFEICIPSLEARLGRVNFVSMERIGIL